MNYFFKRVYVAYFIYFNICIHIHIYKRVKIFSSKIGNSTKGLPGEIINIYDDGIGVRTSDSEIILTDIQIEGKTRELVKNYLNGIITFKIYIIIPC